MSEIKINIDGLEITGTTETETEIKGTTILDIARGNGIDIPTLCHDDERNAGTKDCASGSCGLCVVETEIRGKTKLLRACSTPAENGMIIKTNTEYIQKSRRTTLELLFSDHTGDCRAPCSLACPAETDCQGYVKFIAEGKYDEAVKLIKDKIPLPASIGRVCPHPCETACRRELVEEPISICALKQFAGDIIIDSEQLTINNNNNNNNTTGKKIAVIGGGPAGLTAAYFLRQKNHEVMIYDAMPQMGGMLRYGIPEYRLPKNILQKEIDMIENTGVKFINNTKIGRDITLDYLRDNHNAVIIAVGAWSSMKLGCPGEELDGVISSIDYLRDSSQTPAPFQKGAKVAVIGGGNAAMDVCRTALRSGAGEVYNIYRRTKNEMPANKTEIREAEEEGVIFENLRDPIEIIGDENNKVKAVRLQIMQPGEPDASGRRSVKPVFGKENEKIIEADTVITAIGLKTDITGLEKIRRSENGALAADEHTFKTNLGGVFAIGDATNKGADIAVAAIGEGRRAAEVIDRYLTAGDGEACVPPFFCFSKTEKTHEDFADIEKSPRVKNKFLTEQEAKKEASRCLGCGCHAYSDNSCRLINYAGKYKAQPKKYDGVKNRHGCGYIKDYLKHDPDKCILCGLCVKICGGVILSRVHRGFDTVIRPIFYQGTDINIDIDIDINECISCGGKCAEICPTGAWQRLNL